MGAGRAAYLPATGGKQEISMGKSIYRQNAAEYRSLAETARSEGHRSLMLAFASEWEALADAAARRSKHANSALNPIAAKHSYCAAA